MDKKKFSRWNLLVAAAVFLVSAVTYLSTIEPTASFWDCGEFIASSYKLEVGHPPGNPVFQLIARFFTMFTGPDKAAVMVNAMNALCSALTIFFLYLTIVFLVKRVIPPKREDGSHSTGEAIAIFGSGVVGALAYCFSDTFWFSAVEGEVYAMSSLFTAIVVWAMTKWYETEDRRYANRWIVLISFLMGLSIGVHLLNLLAIPMLVFMYYYKMREDKPYTLWEIVKIFLVSVAILALVLFVIIPLVPKFAAYFDLFFVNTLGLPFNSGAASFMLVLLAACFWGLFKTFDKGKVFWNTALLCFTTIIIGFSIFSIVIIRSSAKTPTNEYQPDNAFTLIRYLSREQYGSTPLLYGQYYGSPYELKQGRYWTPMNGKYIKAASPVEPVYSPSGKMLFPRMYSTDDRAIEFYQTYTEGKGTPIPGADYKKPTFGANLRYFFDFQLGWMYWRYFMWNFVGRQNEIHSPVADYFTGNWESGIKPIDELRLGNQDNAPTWLKENKGMIFFGPTGTGKTFTAACIANALLDKGVPVIMTSLAKLTDSIDFNDASKSATAIIEKFNKADLLIVDDLGVERSTSFAMEKQYEFINGRYASKKPMILTTNLTMDQLLKSSSIDLQRVYERIYESSYLVSFNGPSLRRKRAKEMHAYMSMLLEGD